MCPSEGKFVAVTSAGELIGRAEAVSQRETWEPIFQDGMVAFQGANHRYLAASKDGDLVVASTEVVPEAKFKIRCYGSREKKKEKLQEEDEEFQQDARGFEVDYVKRFQSFQDQKLRLADEDNPSLQKAREKGRLHEYMLDR
jgi:protein FRG1